MHLDKEHHKQRPIRSIVNFLQGIAVSILAFSLIAVIYLTFIYRTRLAPFVNYAIVFDAGSSHTEMFIYYWPADKSAGLGTTSAVNELCVCPLSAVVTNDTTSKPEGEIVKLKAISDFEQHLHLLDTYFRPCLEKAILKIPSNRHRLSPIFLGATAGMRLSVLRNATRAQHVLETIREIFSNQPFQFVTARQVRILTGMEEAIDGWITTNLLLEKFKHRHEKKKRSGVHDSDQIDSDMVGVLDLGGASTQVTFTYVPSVGVEPVPAAYTTNITLFDTTYTPYAHSYLCWGKNEAQKRHRARLVNFALNNNRSTSPLSRTLVRDPCMARGINESFTTNSIFRSPCTINEKKRFHNPSNISSFTFVGAGNASNCRQRLINLFDIRRNDKTVNCTYKQEYCTFDLTFQPGLPTKNHFIGLSGYYYVFNNLAYGMSKSPGQSIDRYKFADFKQEEFDQRLQNVCETNYSVLYQQEGMTSANEQHKRTLCFDAWYMWLLLTHAIGFKQEDLQRLSLANTFPTGKVGWTLGYMINQTNYIPAEYRPRLVSKNTFITWLCISLTLALMACIFLLLTCQKSIRQICTGRKQTINNNNNRHSGYVQPNEQHQQLQA